MNEHLGMKVQDEMEKDKTFAKQIKQYLYWFPVEDIKIQDLFY